MTFAATWPHADADAVGGESGDDMTPPADGLHEVTLTGGGAWTSKSEADWVRFEFVTNDELQHKWTVLLGFKSQSQANMTKRKLRELGVPVDDLGSLDEIDAAIKGQIGSYFTVRVERDGKFENTYVEGPAVADGAPVPAAAPAAAAPAAPAAPAAAAVGADQDIPF